MVLYIQGVFWIAYLKVCVDLWLKPLDVFCPALVRTRGGSSTRKMGLSAHPTHTGSGLSIACVLSITFGIPDPRSSCASMWKDSRVGSVQWKVSWVSVVLQELFPFHSACCPPYLAEAPNLLLSKAIQSFTYSNSLVFLRNFEVGSNNTDIPGILLVLDCYMLLCFSDLCLQLFIHRGS